MRGITLYRGTSALMRLDSNNPVSRRMVTSAVYRGEVMARDTVSVTVVSVAEIHFSQRDYIMYDERLYFLNRIPKAKMVSRSRYEYTLEFEGGMYELARARFDLSALSPAYGFDLCADLYTFCRVIVASMNQLNGGQGWYLDFEQENGDPVLTDEQTLTYERENCLTVMQDLVTKWPEWEWKVDVEVGDVYQSGYVGGILRLRRKGAGSRFTGNQIEMSYGRKGGLESIEKTVPDSAAASRVFFFGGNRNVFGNYRWTRVVLPTAQGGGDSCIERNMTPPNSIYDKVETVDEIYPGNKPFVLSRYVGMSSDTSRDMRIKVKRKAYKASVTGSTLYLSSTDDNVRVFELEMEDGVVDPQTGQFTSPRQFFNLFGKWRPRTVSSVWGCDYAEWRKMYGVADSSASRERYDTYYVGMNCYITTEKPTITFQTGQCAGMTFEILNGGWEVNEDGESMCSLVCLCAENESDYAVENFEVSEIEGLSLPNEQIHPEAGDKFTISGIYMPPRFLYYAGAGDELSAEGQLKSYAEAYMAATANIKEFVVEVSEEWVLKRTKINPDFAIRLYDEISIDEDFMEEYDGHAFRAVYVERNLMSESYALRLSDIMNHNALKLLRDFLRDITR